MANKIETSSKNIKPRTNLNHNIYIEPSKIGGNQQSLSPQTTIVDLEGVIDDIFTCLTSLRHSIFP